MIFIAVIYNLKPHNNTFSPFTKIFSSLFVAKIEEKPKNKNMKKRRKICCLVSKKGN